MELGPQFGDRGPPLGDAVSAMSAQLVARRLLFDRLEGMRPGIRITVTDLNSEQRERLLWARSTQFGVAQKRGLEPSERA